MAVFSFGLLLPLGEMIRLHPYQYTTSIISRVRCAPRRSLHAGLLGLALKQASDGLRDEINERQEVRRTAANGRSRCASARPGAGRARPDFTIGWDSHAADFAMTLGEFYCKGLTRRCWWKSSATTCVRARLRYPRRSISSLLSIPAPETKIPSLRVAMA